ncbi:hypothetical protein Tco_1301672 [Tanacetum coccineum]
MTGDNTVTPISPSEKLSAVTHHHLLTRVPVKIDLDDWNYGQWDYFFVQMCESYDIDKYLCTPTTDSNTSSSAPLTPEELKVDKIVLSWILFTLFDSLRARVTVARPKSAKEAWSLISDIVKDNKRSLMTSNNYIRLEEEKAHRHGKVYNWETTTYGKIWDKEDVHDLGSVETEFPSIVFNDTLISEAALSCEPTVSSLNNEEIDFRISFDESDDEDCTIIFDKNSFSYKIIYVNDLKTDSKNDNDKVNMPLLPSPKPTVSYFDDLDFFKDFENEFPAIVYNDAQTSKSDLLTEPILNPQHIDEFDLKDETSLSKCDEEEQNVLYFNDLFSFNVIYPDELKTDTDNDNDKVDIEHSSGDLSVKPLPDVINTDVGAYAHGSNKLLETRPRERNIDDYWWRIYISGDFKVLES